MILKRRHELHVKEADVTTLTSESKICTIKEDIRKLKKISSLYKNTITHLLKTTRDLQRLASEINWVTLKEVLKVISSRLNHLTKKMNQWREQTIKITKFASKLVYEISIRLTWLKAQRMTANSTNTFLRLTKILMNLQAWQQQRSTKSQWEEASLSVSPTRKRKRSSESTVHFVQEVLNDENSNESYTTTRLALESMNELL